MLASEYLRRSKPSAISNQLHYVPAIRTTDCCRGAVLLRTSTALVVTALCETVLQQLTKTRGLPKRSRLDPKRVALEWAATQPVRHSVYL
jgi:hypothetical protein